jgi:hypothetical protein
MVLRTRIFGVWVLAATKAADGRLAKDVFLPKHYNQARSCPETPV